MIPFRLGTRSLLLTTLCLLLATLGIWSVALAAVKSIKPKSGGELVLIPAGTFIMGDAKGRTDETPHSVKISALYVDRYLVTQEQFEKIMKFNPSKARGIKNPVEQIRWTDAIIFCNKASLLDGLTPCYNVRKKNCNFQANGYRLPTEAEWEYAYRAGGKTRFFFGDNEAKLPQYGWFKKNANGKTHPVGQKLPNAWGLYDMSGNVWQWCNDWYTENYYQKSSKINPTGPLTGTMRVLRGGAWDANADKCRAAYRFHEYPSYTDACFGFDNYGFRCVRNAH